MMIHLLIMLSYSDHPSIKYDLIKPLHAPAGCILNVMEYRTSAELPRDATQIPHDHLLPYVENNLYDMYTQKDFFGS